MSIWLRRSWMTAATPCSADPAAPVSFSSEGDVGPATKYCFRRRFGADSRRDDHGGQSAHPLKR
jgi:hypothetical protein